MSECYVKFDEFGLAEIYCMCCHCQIAGRTYTEIESRVTPGKTEKVLSTVRYSNYRQKKITLPDGSYANILLCVDCIPKQQDSKEMMKQIKAGHKAELKFAK